tara:strand:- start:272 stop:526 length:255 start_codon:yes stop_codon:yes gene_type:complete
MKKDGDDFQSVDQRVSFSDVVVSVQEDDERDSLGEDGFNGYNNYQRQNKQRKTNQQKLWYCCVGITMIVILIFFIIISIALWMN